MNLTIILQQFKDKKIKSITEKNVQDKDESYYMASQWQLMMRKFKKHHLAKISIFVLSLLYAGAIFGNFLAPQGLSSYDQDSINMPPTKIHIIDNEGKLSLPFVYGIKSERDPETWMKVYVEDKVEKYPIKLFVKGEAYTLWWLFDSNRHLFGVDEPGKIFLFGTDSMGKDLFSRIIHGSKISLSIGFVGVIISMVLGTIIGSVSGYFGGMVDTVIERFLEILRSFPSIPLWLTLSAAIPPHLSSIMVYFWITIILSLIGWPSLARTVRSKFMSMKEEDFVMAARVSGCSVPRIIGTHLVPGFLSYFIVSLTLSIPAMIVSETSLSFLGLGIRAPSTSWGVLLQEAQQIQNVVLYPWRLIPLAFVIITVLAFNFMGDGLRDAADPYK